MRSDSKNIYTKDIILYDENNKYVTSHLKEI